MHRFSGLELKSISLNTFVQFFLRITTSIPTLIATLLIAYFAGYQTLGSFTKIVTFVSIFYLLIDFGMNSIFLKQHFENIEKQYGNLIFLRLFLSLILILVVIFITPALPQNNISGFSIFEKFGIMLFSLTLIFIGINTSLQSLLQKRLSYYLSITPTILSSIVLLLLVLIASFQKNLYLLLFAYIASGLVLSISLIFVVVKKYNVNFKVTPDFSKFSKALLLSSLPLGTMLFFNLLYARADTFILSIMRPTVEVGIYGISYKFFEVLLSFPTYLSNSIYPLLLSGSKKPKNYLPLIRKYSYLFIGVSILITVVAFFLSPIIQLFKPEFIKSVLPLQILILSLPFFFLTSLLQWHFLILDKLKFLVPLYSGALILNVILNIIFIPQYSYVASAIITGGCEALVFVGMICYFLKSKMS